MHFSLSTILPLLLPLLSTTSLANPIRTIELPNPSNSSLAARDQMIGQSAHMTIKFYSSPACGESVISLWDHIQYNNQMFGRSASFTLSRDLVDKETLDFSTGSDIPPNVYAMEDAVAPKGAQYPGPGYFDGGFKVPSQCDSFYYRLPARSPAKNAQGKHICYTPPKLFNCVRLWMQS